MATLQDECDGLKEVMHRSPKLLRIARGMPCMVRGPTCNHNTETTVWGHLNGSLAGKGIGMKGHDMLGFFTCSSCHHEIDHGKGTREERRLLAYEALVRTWAYLLEMNMVVILVK